MKDLRQQPDTRLANLAEVFDDCYEGFTGQPYQCVHRATGEIIRGGTFETFRSGLYDHDLQHNYNGDRGVFLEGPL